MKPPVHYYGGKVRLAPWIVSMIPEHRVYIEPFFGAGAVLFAKPPSQFEIINDIDDNVVNFFTVLREKTDDLERACTLTPHARAEYSACGEPSDDPVEQARRWWVRCTQGFSSLPAKSGWSLSTAMGSSGARTLQSLVGRFAPVAERLATVSIEHGDAADLINKLGRYPDTVIYVDPPYLGTTRAGLAKRPKDYAHDFSREDEHRRLAEVLGATQATVLLSGYHSPLYDELYGDWAQVSREVDRPAGRIRGQARPMATEVLWSNRPLAVPNTFDLAGA